MAKKPTQDTFMDDVACLLHARLGKNQSLVIWRGKYPIKFGYTTDIFDTLVVGLADDKESKEPPPIVLLKVWLNIMAHYDFDDGQGTEESSAIPFGGGWIPIKKVEEKVELLEKFTW